MTRKLTVSRSFLSPIESTQVVMETQDAVVTGIKLSADAQRGLATDGAELPPCTCPIYDRNFIADAPDMLINEPYTSWPPGEYCVQLLDEDGEWAMALVRVYGPVRE